MTHTTEHNNQTAKRGFTLIELSIVLVIIGLIVGGVLVGQDLIKAAEIRATISQMEKYDTAANTFRGKYNGLPGDLLNAQNFLLQGTVANLGGNGDGLVANTVAGANANVLCGENILIPQHLFSAGLDPFSPTIANVQARDDACVTSTVATESTTLVPGARIGKGNQVFTTSTGGINYYLLAAVTSSTTALTIAQSLTAIEAFQIDSKIDDGVSSNGRVISIAPSVITTFDAGGTTATDCNSTTGVYTSTATTQECALRIRTSF